MSASLVGSEMCIRDRASTLTHRRGSARHRGWSSPSASRRPPRPRGARSCLLYTSDAADDM
eukprot:1169294-Alexandrium_andersonii.AAC.1